MISKREVFFYSKDILIKNTPLLIKNIIYEMKIINYFIKVALVLSIAYLSLPYTSVAQNNISIEQKAILDSIASNPTGMIYFFDGKKISEKDMYLKGIKGELSSISGIGANAGKKAIKKYGEYYRNGVIFFNKREVIFPPAVTYKGINTLFKKVTNKRELDKGGFVLRGTIAESYNGKPIMLFLLDENVIKVVDTAFIQNGRFEFYGKEYLNDIGLLSIGNYPDKVISQTVFLDKGIIYVSLDNNRIGGTYLNNLYQSYIDTNSRLKKELQIANLEKNNNFVKRGSPLEKKHIEIGKYTVSFKKNNINNLVGQYFFENEAGKTLSEGIAYPSTNMADSAFFIVYNCTTEKYKQKRWINEYLLRLEDTRDKQLTQSHLKNKLFTDFTLKDINGKERKISQYIGKSKYVVLDFWASWCGACIGSIPDMIKIYNKYDNKTLQIIGISLDTDLSSWKKALNKYQLPWIQLISGNENLNKKLNDAYGFIGIPYWVLLDDTGKIVDYGSSAQMLEIKKLND